jgi:hypothetical protein
MPTRQLFALAALLLAAPLAGQNPPPTPKPADSAAAKPKSDKPTVDLSSKLKFMEGCWKGRIDDKNDVEENWSSPADNLLLSTTRYLRKNHATGWEFSRIEATDSGVMFIASSSSKAVEDAYTMKTLVDDYVVFENPKKAFPQKIIYRMASDGALIPRNEGDGPSVEVRFARVKCPGADIKLKP